MSHRAFTLIEVTLVVLLVGLLAGAAAMSFARPLRAARVREAVAEISAFDAAARRLARRSGREVEMMIDVYEQRLTRSEQDREPSHLSLPSGLRIEQVRSSGSASHESQVAIRVTPHGWSRSYAVRIVGAELDRWLLVAGMTGQITVIEDESKVDDILSRAAATAGRDAD